MRQYENNRFVQTSTVSPIEIKKFDLMVSRILTREYEMIDLSPLAPLGANSVVATVDQNNAVTTIRNTEVCSDNTNLLALECAIRRKKVIRENPKAPNKIRLVSSHRVVRPQMFYEPVSFAHFQLLGICTAGRDRGSFGFESESLSEHLDFYIRLLQEAMKQGYKFNKVRIMFTAFNENCLAAIKSIQKKYSFSYPDFHFQLDQQRQNGRGYYGDIAFQIWISNVDNQDYLIVDGGLTDWTQKLLGNRKERLLISGLGSERFIICFGPGRK
jgi:hypothetical protein